MLKVFISMAFLFFVSFSQAEMIVGQAGTYCGTIRVIPPGETFPWSWKFFLDLEKATNVYSQSEIDNQKPQLLITNSTFDKKGLTLMFQDNQYYCLQGEIGGDVKAVIGFQALTEAVDEKGQVVVNPNPPDFEHSALAN